MEFNSLMRRYKYLGDRLTAPELRGAICYAVIVDGKCVRRGSSMLVSVGKEQHVVLASR
ncbi:MAG TPA: hypothetical protein VK589_18545 [Chryseolinea sp.]|nr:hypothetical protein [Chryseolinea sp.]